MGSHRIAVIRGDGIGIEVVEEGLNVLKSVSENHPFEFEVDEFTWGYD